MPSASFESSREGHVRVQNGSPCHEAEVNASGRRLRVVATQAADRGQRPAVLAFQRLQRYHFPAIVALVARRRRASIGSTR